MSLSLNLTGIRATATQISPRSVAVVGKTPVGASVKLHSAAGDLASPRKQRYDAGSMSVSAHRYSAQLNATPRSLGERSVAQKFGPTGSARLYSTASGPSAAGRKALTEAKQFLEDYRCGRVDDLLDVYPPEDKEFAIWFKFNVPPRFADAHALRAVQISPEAMSAFERRMEAKINNMPPGDPSLKAALGDMVKEFVRSEAAKPENRNLLGVAPETRMSILDRQDLEPEQKAVMFLFLGDLKEWGYLKGGAADHPTVLPSFGEASRFIKGALGHLSGEVAKMPKLRLERFQAALENAERFAVESSLPSDRSPPPPENDLRSRTRKYAEAAFAESSRDRIPEEVQIWVEMVNADLPVGLPPVSASRILGHHEWAKVEQALEAEFSSAEKVSSPSGSGSDLPLSVRKTVDHHAQFASGDNWADIPFQMSVGFNVDMESDSRAQVAAANAIATSLTRRYSNPDNPTADMVIVSEIAMDLARRGY